MPVPLSQTSAFVLVCDKNQSYQSLKSKEFLSSLDLSEGQKMYNKMTYLNPHLDEMIPNRKFFIHNYIRQILKKYKSEVQVLVLACGWDPILIKMNEEFSENRFFGVDSESVRLNSSQFKKSCLALLFFILKQISP